MATESSAVVRFIAAAQQSNQPIQEGPDALPDFTDDVRMAPPVRGSVRVLRFALLLLAIGAVVGGAVYAGITIGKRSSSPSAGDGSAAAAIAPVPAAPASSAGPGVAASPAAPVAAPPASTPPLLPPAPAAIPAEVLAETGFDIRVKPPGMVSLDGQVLGRAPLRIRNLNPGKHVVEIEAPAGYFSHRVEIELAPGVPQNVNLRLDPIDPSGQAEKETAGTQASAVAQAAGEPGAEPAAKPPEETAESAAKPPEKAAAPAPRRSVRRSARRPTRKPAARAEAKAPASEAIDQIGTLMLGSKPPCDIYIDGAATGLKTPQRSIQLAAGPHRIRLVHPELGIEKTFTIDVRAGQITRSIHDLTGKL